MVEQKSRITGDEEFQKSLRKFPRELKPAMESAGKEFSAEVLGTEGLERYPPASGANQAPTPYYMRGTGMQYNSGNDLSSERYGTKFSVAANGYKTTIGNTASYAAHLGGVKQAVHMAELGWRRLIDVVKEKLGVGRKIYVAWVERALRKAGLK